MMIHPHIVLVGSASGWGAQKRSTEKGPPVLWEGNLPHDLEKMNIHVSWGPIIYPKQKAEDVHIPCGKPTLGLVVEQNKKISRVTEDLLIKGHFPVLIGGDHAMAVGTFTGAVRGLNAQQKMGLIWIDAHMDAHVPETSPSQAYHGMPVAALLGYGEDTLVHLRSSGAKLKPQHVVLIGVRSYEKEEANLLKKLGVKIYTMDDIKKSSFEKILKEATDYITNQVDVFGVSFDLDALDPEDAPGVGSPEPDGLRLKEVLPALKNLSQNNSFKVLEITEYNPELDEDNLTYHCIEKILQAILPISCSKSMCA